MQDYNSKLIFYNHSHSRFFQFDKVFPHVASHKQNFEKGYAEGMQLIAGQITNSNAPIEEKKHSR